MRALAVAMLLAADAAAASAPIRLGSPGLAIFQPTVAAKGSLPVLSLAPALQPLPQLRLSAALAAPAAPQAAPAAMPALETLADKVQPGPAVSAASAIDSFYDRSAFQAAPAETDRSAPLAKDPDTGLYGVSQEQLRTVVSILRKHYGENLLDLAAIGSRAKGKASALKNFRPPTGYSDLDLAPLLRDRGGRNPDSSIIEREIEAATGIPIQLHGVLSAGEQKYKEAVPFYGGGYETYEWFSSGDAKRIDLNLW